MWRVPSLRLELVRSVGWRVFLSCAAVAVCSISGPGLCGDDVPQPASGTLAAGSGVGVEELGAAVDVGLLSMALVFHQCFLYIVCSGWGQPWWLLVLVYTFGWHCRSLGACRFLSVAAACGLAAGGGDLHPALRATQVVCALLQPLFPPKKSYTQLRQECRLAGVSQQGTRREMLKRLRGHRLAPEGAMTHSELGRRVRRAGLTIGRDDRRKSCLIDLWRTVPSMGVGSTRRLTFVDYYCGMGGASLGALQSGYSVLAGVDSDAVARACYQDNFGCSCVDADLTVEVP